MTCPGGCLGGGQPIPTKWDIRKHRAESIYQEFLKEPLGEFSHHLLHTSYEKRRLYVWRKKEPVKKKEQFPVALH